MRLDLFTQMDSQKQMEVCTFQPRGLQCDSTCARAFFSENNSGKQILWDDKDLYRQCIALSETIFLSMTVVLKDATINFYSLS